LSKVLGKEVPLQILNDETFAALISKSGMPAAMAPFVVGMHRAIREGALDVKSGDLENLMGRAATPLLAGLEEIVKGLAVAA
jgi:NAD(P)H dehydrogenase (quinone)